MSEQSQTIKVKTSRFGELDVAQSAIIDVFAGLVGFPKTHKFILLDYTPPFSWLQAVDNPDLAFVVLNAAEFGENYVFDLPYNDRELDLNRDDEVAILNVASIRSDPTLSSVNLKAPIVVNLRNRKGRQIILDDPRYPTRMPLWASKEAEPVDKGEKK
jgi:flagellar assembly factor FliW